MADRYHKEEERMRAMHIIDLLDQALAKLDIINARFPAIHVDIAIKSLVETYAADRTIR